MKKSVKIVFAIFILIIILSLMTLFNYFLLINKSNQISESYLTDMINNNTDNVDYEFIYNDLKKIDNEIKLRNIKNNDYNELINYYYFAGEIYNNKINELTYILNNILDDQDFKYYLNDIEEFNTNLQNETNDIEKDYNNEQIINLYKYKYIYEKRHEKCYSILETYKGFLN